MSVDSGNGAISPGDPAPDVPDAPQADLLGRLDDLTASVVAFQEQMNKQFVWLRTDIDNLRRYVKALGQRTQTLEDDMLSRPLATPLPSMLPEEQG